MPGTSLDDLRGLNYEDYLVRGKNGLWRFQDPNPSFEDAVRVWAVAAEGRFDVAELDWMSLAPNIRRLMCSVAAPWPWRHPERTEPEHPLLIDETHDAIIELVRGLSTGHIAPDWVDWDAMTTRTRNVIWVLSRYEIRRLREISRERRRGSPQKKAMRLLRTLLTPNQLWWLRNRRYFLVGGHKTNHTYRLRPQYGTVSRVTKHKTRWFVHTQYCLHDPDVKLPPADVSISHLLLLRADEDRFLSTANATDARSMFWNGDWLRRVRRTRLRMQAEAANEG